MKKSINVDNTFSGMRIDRFLRRYFVSIPQSLIERNLRNGKIKLNNRKIKSSTKVKKNDLIELFNFDIKKSVIVKKEKFKPSNTIIKENEDFIIENNDNFLDSSATNGNSDEEDLLENALEIVRRDRKCSTSYIQRKLSIGYNRAAKIVEALEEKGFVSPANHVGKRDVLIPENNI